MGSTNWTYEVRKPRNSCQCPSKRRGLFILRCNKAVKEGERRERAQEAAQWEEMTLQTVTPQGVPAFKIDGHPKHRYNGLYFPAEHWQQGRHFVNEDGMHVYYYENNRYRCWSFDHRSQSPSNLTDWYAGGWIDLTKLPTHRSKECPPLGLIWLEYGYKNGVQTGPLGFVRIMHPDQELPPQDCVVPSEVVPEIVQSQTRVGGSRNHAPLSRPTRTCPTRTCAEHLKASKPKATAECYELLGIKSSTGKLRKMGLKALEELEGSSVASALEGCCVFAARGNTGAQRQATAAFQDASLFLVAEQHRAPFNASHEHWPDLPSPPTLPCIQASRAVPAVRDASSNVRRVSAASSAASSSCSENWEDLGVRSASFCSSEEQDDAEQASLCSDMTAEEEEWVLTGTLHALSAAPLSTPEEQAALSTPEEQAPLSTPEEQAAHTRSSAAGAVRKAAGEEEEAREGEDAEMGKGRRSWELGEERRGWGRKGARERQMRRARKQRGVMAVLEQDNTSEESGRRHTQRCRRLVVQGEDGGEWVLRTRRGRPNPFAAPHLRLPSPPAADVSTLQSDPADPRAEDAAPFPTVACPLVLLA